MLAPTSIYTVEVLSFLRYSLLLSINASFVITYMFFCFATVFSMKNISNVIFYMKQLRSFKYTTWQKPPAKVFFYERNKEIPSGTIQNQIHSKTHQSGVLPATRVYLEQRQLIIIFFLPSKNY